jgi:ASC-1-like (ASCH) protein
MGIVWSLGSGVSTAAPAESTQTRRNPAIAAPFEAESTIIGSSQETSPPPRLRLYFQDKAFRDVRDDRKRVELLRAHRTDARLAVGEIVTIHRMPTYQEGCIETGESLEISIKRITIYKGPDALRRALEMEKISSIMSSIDSVMAVANEYRLMGWSSVEANRGDVIAMEFMLESIPMMESVMNKPADVIDDLMGDAVIIEVGATRGAPRDAPRGASQ